MADIGYLALCLALVVSFFSVFAFIANRRRLSIMARSARYGVIALFGLISSAVIILLCALITHNFQIEYPPPEQQ